MRAFLFLLFGVSLLYAADSVAVPDTFVAPKIILGPNNNWEPTYCEIFIYDQSNCETGYKIFRDSGSSSGHYTLIAQTTSLNPASHDTISFSDYTVLWNSIYFYKVETYNASDSIFSSPLGLYLLPANIHNRLKDASSLRSNFQAIPDLLGSSVTFAFQDETIHNSNIIIYDLSGHVVDKMSDITSNKITWRPSRSSGGCYIAAAKIDGVSYLARFIMK